MLISVKMYNKGGLRARMEEADLILDRIPFCCATIVAFLNVLCFLSNSLN